MGFSIGHIGGVVHSAVVVGVPIDLIGNLVFFRLITVITSAHVDLNGAVVRERHARWHSEARPRLDGEGDILRHGQGLSLRHGQGLTVRERQIFVQRDRAVDAAAVAVKPDAVPLGLF